MEKETTPLSIILIKQMCYMIQECGCDISAFMIDLNATAYFQMEIELYVIGVFPEHKGDSMKIKWDNIEITFVKQTENAAVNNS